MTTKTFSKGAFAVLLVLAAACGDDDGTPEPDAGTGVDAQVPNRDGGMPLDANRPMLTCSDETMGSTIGTECFTNTDCQDGCYCNGDEICSGGTCVAGAVPCTGSECATATCDEDADACDIEVDNTVCDDGAFCTTGETCTAGTCDGGGATDCSAFDDQCNTGTCNEGADTCEATPANEGDACDDGAFCTTGETCTAGTCDGGGATDCSAFDDQCNTGTCDEATGECIAPPVEEPVDCALDGMSCEDGACVGCDPDSCGDGVCIDGACVNACEEEFCPEEEAYCEGDLAYGGGLGVCDPATGDCAYPPPYDCATDGLVCEEGVCVTPPARREVRMVGWVSVSDFRSRVRPCG